MDNGRLSMDANLLIAGSNQATNAEPEKPNEMVKFPIYTVLIDHPEGKILFDTACNPDSMGSEGRWPDAVQVGFPLDQPEECYLPHRLEQLGVRPEDISFVVCSHLHMDHAGCLELFTRAKIIVHRDELNGALNVYAHRESSGAYIWDDIDAWMKNGLMWEPIEPDKASIKLAEGVEVLNFGSGHAWGMLGLQVELEEKGTIILASDALYTKDSAGPPLRPPGIIYDSIGWQRSANYIKALAKDRDADIWYGHDANQFEAFRKSTDGYYE
ncbi:N-acyl homoserine lactonase family protein [Geomicrobium sp. JSM 1781026]|uniref:N-acyl homoserine lactonase family protein n=1 Tax=Geomicrobium sp. JSM 1781026 TaxID=3344580 RepID=UPI0035BFF0F2